VAIAWVLIIAGGISLVVGLILLATTNTPVAKQESGFFNSAPPTPARQPAPPPPQRYTAYEKEQRLGAVDEIYKVISTQIAPLQPEGQSLFGHNLLSLMGDGTADQKLNDHARKVEAAFANLTGLLKQYEYYPDIVQTLSQKPVFNQIEESNAARNLISTVAFIRQHVEPQWAGQALDRDVTLLEARNANQHFEQFLRTITPLLQQKRAEIEKAEIYSGK
jgi:lipopolysaccharide export system protein LptC